MPERVVAKWVIVGFSPACLEKFQLDEEKYDEALPAVFQPLHHSHCFVPTNGGQQGHHQTLSVHHLELPLKEMWF